MNEQERIETLIAKAGSGRKLADLLGTTDASISKLRSGKFRLAVFAEKIAHAFPDLNCRWLLTGEGEPFAKEAAEGEIRAELRALRDAVEELAAKVGGRP